MVHENSQSVTSEESGFNTQIVVQPLHLDCQVTSVHINISWNSPVDITDSDRIEYVIEWNCLQDETNEFICMKSTEIDFETTPGQIYWVKVECRTIDGNVLIAIGTRELKAVFSIEEQHILYCNAMEYVGDAEMYPIDVVNRCKLEQYWDEIEISGQGIMQTRLKDTCGQPANRINGMLHGLFFYARSTNDGTLPPESPFGDKRFVMDTHHLLHPEYYNFYFADFYCLRAHYVTIVVSRKGSVPDSYCRENLRMISIYDNPFIQVTHTFDAQQSCLFYSFWGTKKVWVEIYHTENIPLACGKLEKINRQGSQDVSGLCDTLNSSLVTTSERDEKKKRKDSKENSKVKENNRKCIHCNLNPEPTTKEQKWLEKNFGH